MKKHYTLILLLVLPILLFAQYDEVPNNTIDEAPLVALPASFTQSIDSINDIDYFKLQIDIGGVLNIDITNLTANIDFTVTITESSGDLVMTKEGGNGEDLFLSVLTCPGIYFLELHDGTDGPPGDYIDEFSLVLNNVDITFDTEDVYECNNIYDDAVNIPINTALQFKIDGYSEFYGDPLAANYDVDIFKIHTDIAGILNVDIINLTGIIDFTVSIVDSSTNDVLTTQEGSNGSDMNFGVSICSGTFYIKLTDGSDGSPGDYIHELSPILNTLTLTFDTEDIFECNNTIADATEIPINTTLQFKIDGLNDLYGYEDDLPYDVDYFKFSTIEAGVLNIAISNFTDNLDFTITIIDSASNEIVALKEGDNGDNVSLDALLCFGTFYLRIDDGSDGAPGDYINELNPALNTLTLLFDNTETCECNNVFLDACEIPTDTAFITHLNGVNNIYGITPNDRDYFIIHPTCTGEISVSLTNGTTNIETYLYIRKDDLAHTAIDNLYATPGNSDNLTFLCAAGDYYYLELYDSGDTEVSDEDIVISISLNPDINADFSIEPDSIVCEGTLVSLSANVPDLDYLWSNGATTQSVEISTSGEYSLTVTDGSCVITSDTSAILINPKPDAIITSDGMNLTASLADTYQWYLNGTELSGATDQSYAPTETGNYTVYITDANGCSNTSEAYYYEVVSIANLSLSKINIYPNPASTELTIELNELIGAPAVISIYTIEGILVYNYFITNNLYKLALNSLSSGNYLVQIKAESSVVNVPLSIIK